MRNGLLVEMEGAAPPNDIAREWAESHSHNLSPSKPPNPVTLFALPECVRHFQQPLPHKTISLAALLKQHCLAYRELGFDWSDLVQ